MAPPRTPHHGTTVAALAGRRIDADDAGDRQFPLDRSDPVRSNLIETFREEAVGLLVCSAACGADLLALDAALELGVRCRVVLPYARAEFRRTSVMDRPGPWGAVFDRVITRIHAAGDLVTLSASPGDDRAYGKATAEIVRQAANAAAPGRAVAILVWEGRPRESGDATAEFRHLASVAGMRERTVSTC